MRTTLLGGSGFLGSALSEALIKRGGSVLSASRTGVSVPGATGVKIDLYTDQLSLAILEGTENVFILFGQTGPHFDAQRELLALNNVLSVLKKTDQRILFCSTVLVYGECTIPATEESPCRPIGPYPTFKLTAEALVRASIPEHRRTILRLSNVYGTPKNRGFLDYALRAALTTDTPPLTLNGNGQLRRDYVFIDDVIEAMIRLMELPTAVETINIATGTSYTLQQIMDELSMISGRLVPYTPINDTLDEASSILISNHLLQQKIGPLSFTPLQDGLRQTLERYQ